MSNLSEIKTKIENDELSPDEAYKIISNPDKKPWQTKAWKANRNSLIKDYCEQCGATQKPFALQHLDGKRPSYQEIKRTVLRNAFHDHIDKNPSKFEISEDEIDKFITYNSRGRDACPKCRYLAFNQRKTMIPEFRCANCGLEFDKPICVDYIEKLKTKTDTPRERGVIRDYLFGQIYHREFKKFEKELDKEVSKFAILKAIEEFEEYLSCKNTLTFCKKCAFMMNMKGWKLCEVCKKHYHDMYLYDTCLACSTVKKDFTNNEVTNS